MGRQEPTSSNVYFVSRQTTSQHTELQHLNLDPRSLKLLQRQVFSMCLIIAFAVAESASGGPVFYYAACVWRIQEEIMLKIVLDPASTDNWIYSSRLN